jgi:hypothetical protein
MLTQACAHLSKRAAFGRRDAPCRRQRAAPRRRPTRRWSATRRWRCRRRGRASTPSGRARAPTARGRATQAATCLQRAHREARRASTHQPICVASVAHVGDTRCEAAFCPGGCETGRPAASRESAPSRGDHVSAMPPLACSDSARLPAMDAAPRRPTEADASIEDTAEHWRLTPNSSVPPPMPRRLATWPPIYAVSRRDSGRCTVFCIATDVTCVSSDDGRCKH